MSRERWFRGERDGQERPLDWHALARQHGIDPDQARRLYEEARRRARAHRDARRREEVIYLELLAAARQAAARPAPGKVTRTMRRAAERAGKARSRARISPLTGQPIAPAKRPLTAHLARRAGHGDREARERARLEAVRDALARMGHVPGAAPEAPLTRERAFLHQVPAGTPIDIRSRSSDEVRRRVDACWAIASGNIDELDAQDRALFAARPPGAETTEPARTGHEPPGARPPAPVPERPRSRVQGDALGSARRRPGAGARVRRPVERSRDGARRPATRAMPAMAVALDRVSGQRQAELGDEMTQHVLAGLEASPGEPLPPALARRMGRLLGHDFGHVSVHTDERAAEAAALLGARAFTMGARVYFGRGQWAPGTAPFERLLAHELTHVVQHDQGRLRPGPAGQVRVAAPGESSEREAEAVARQVAAAPDTETQQPDTPGPARAHIAETPQAGAAPDPGAQRPGAPGPARVATAGSEQAGAARGGGQRERATAGPGASAGNVAARDLLPSLSDIVRRISPELATLIDEGPLGMIRELIEAGIDTLLSPITGILDSVGGTIDELMGSFGEVFSFIQGLFAGDPGCCEAFVDGIDRIRSIAQSIADNPVIQAIQDGLGQVSGAIEQVAMMVLSPAFDLVKDLLGGAWDGITGLADTISGWLQPILDFSRDAWEWVMEQLGIGGGGEGGILSWLTDTASEAWSSIAETLGPVAGPLQAVAGVLVALSPVGPLVMLVRYGPDLVQAVQWLWQNRESPDIVQQAHAEMGHTILPGLLGAAQGFGGAVQSAATWLVDQATSLSTGLLELLGAITGVPLLGLVQGAVQTFSQGATRLAQWATGELSAAAEGLQSGLAALQAFIAPYADVLCSVGMAIVNPGMIPVILAGHAWMALPDCIKAPIIDLLLDAAIAVLEAAPTLLLFGPLWPILKNGILGFLRGLRAQPSEVKEQVSNKIARILSGSSPAFLLGFVKGFLTGVWEGLTDPFVLVWTAVQGLGNLVSWLGGLARQAVAENAPGAQGGAQAPAGGDAAAASTAAASGSAAPAAGSASAPAPAELGARAREMATELQPPVEQVTGGFWPAVQSLFQGGEGLTLEGLIARLRGVWSSIEQAIQGAGASMATRVCEFFMADEAEGQLGEAVGWLAGTIAFEVLLGVLTAGAWQPVSAAGRALQAFARILDWTGEALGAAFRLLGRIGGALLDALRGLGRMLASAGGPVRQVLDALGEIGQKLMAFADELLARFGRGVGGEAAQEASERTAREGAEELGEEATEAVAERAGREGAQEAGEESTEEAAEQGGKRADEAPDMSEKLRVAAEAKVMSDALERTGMPANAIVSALSRAFMLRYRWIRRFEAEPTGLGRFTIWMIASRVKVDDILPRPDTRELPSSVTTSNGLVIDLPPAQLQHALDGHTLESFDPVARLAELDRQGIMDANHVTHMFKPGTVTNPQELSTLIRQALEGRAGANLSASARTATTNIRGHNVMFVIGAQPGGAGMRFITAFPTSGRGLTRAQIASLAAQMQSGAKSLQDIRREILALLG